MYCCHDRNGGNNLVPSMMWVEDWTQIIRTGCMCLYLLSTYLNGPKLEFFKTELDFSKLSVPLDIKMVRIFLEFEKKASIEYLMKTGNFMMFKCLCPLVKFDHSLLFPVFHRVAFTLQWLSYIDLESYIMN